MRLKRVIACPLPPVPVLGSSKDGPHFNLFKEIQRRNRLGENRRERRRVNKRSAQAGEEEETLKNMMGESFTSKNTGSFLDIMIQGFF